MKTEIQTENKEQFSVSLYERKVLSLGKAAALAHLHRIQFQKELAVREIPIHYSEQDLENDLDTLDRLSI